MFLLLPITRLDMHVLLLPFSCRHARWQACGLWSTCSIDQDIGLHSHGKYASARTATATATVTATTRLPDWA